MVLRNLAMGDGYKPTEDTQNIGGVAETQDVPEKAYEVLCPKVKSLGGAVVTSDNKMDAGVDGALKCDGSATSGLFQGLTDSYMANGTPLNGDPNSEFKMNETTPDSINTYNTDIKNQYGDTELRGYTENSECISKCREEPTSVLEEWRSHVKEILDAPLEGMVSEDIKRDISADHERIINAIKHTSIEKIDDEIKSIETQTYEEKPMRPQVPEEKVSECYQTRINACTEDNTGDRWVEEERRIPLGNYIASINEGETLVIPYKRRGLDPTRKNINETRKIFERNATASLRERKAKNHSVTDLTQEVLSVQDFSNGFSKIKQQQNSHNAFEEQTNCKAYEKERDLVELAKRPKEEPVSDEIEVQYLENETKTVRRNPIRFIILVLTCGIYR